MAIRFRNRYYNIPGLSFVQGDAQSLPSDDKSVDAVTNVESSHCYPAMDRLLYEVYRVLRPQGYFLFADHRSKGHVEALRTQLCHAGFAILREQRVTLGILRALDLDNGRKRRLIERNIPRILQGFFSEFAAVEETRGLYAKFVSGDKEYLDVVCRKGDTATGAGRT